ncbi:MAG: hypothetical protein ACON4Z_12770 [Planctomycetota bacterium]
MEDVHREEEASAAGIGEGRSHRSRWARRGPLYTGVLVALAAALFVLEQFVLQGEQVFDERIGSSRDVRVEIPLMRAGEPHLLEVSCRRKNKLTVTVQAPDGEVLAEVNEWSYHKRHFLEFTPKVAGTYVLEGTQRYRSTRSSDSRVEVFVNDSRFFQPWGYALGW